MAAATHLVKSSTIKSLPGYVDFAGIKEIFSPEFAGMPVSALPDQTELTLSEINGNIWAQLSERLYSPSEIAVPLEVGNKILKISPEGFNEWLIAKENLILNFEKSAKGRVIVFSPDNVNIYDSAVDEGEIFVKSGSLIELSAPVGDSFKVIAR